MCVGMGKPDCQFPILESTWREVDIRGVCVLGWRALCEHTRTARKRERGEGEGEEGRESKWSQKPRQPTVMRRRGKRTRKTQKEKRERGGGEGDYFRVRRERR